MGDDRRWAARYQFLEPLWRGRDRIICDHELEAVLHAGVEGPLAGLLADLIPGEGGDARAWVALHNDRRAASFARRHSGTVFVGLDDAAELASDEGWQVALVNLDDGSTTTLDAFLEVAGERSEDDAGRSVILTLTIGNDEDQSYEQLAELVEQLFGDGRIYGLARPPMAAFYDFGPVLEPEAAQAGGDGSTGDESTATAPAPAPEVEAAGVDVDTTLGSDAPRFELFVAVVGSRLPGEGVTFVELPTRLDTGAAPGSPSSAEADELAALRVQLAEAQRRADLHAIERQKLLEKVEQAEDRIAALDEELESLGGAADEAPGGSAGPRLDEALVREQSLRWELDRVRGELENLHVRPVEDLEAELASTTARLEQVEALLAEDEAELDELAAAEPPLASASGSPAADEPSVAQAREWMKARARLDHVLRKLERGGALSALELHRELSALRRVL